MSQLSTPKALALFLLSAAVTFALVYAYTFWLPQHIGFENTLLLGIVTLVFVTASSDD